MFVKIRSESIVWKLICKTQLLKHIWTQVVSSFRALKLYFKYAYSVFEVNF
jgi:hypothetical protein